MKVHAIHRVTSRIAVALSILALLTVLSGYLHPPQHETDEGSAAHIFQIAIVLLFPALLLFLATADWKAPWQSLRPLAIPAIVVMMAFAALYYLEHYR